MVKIISWLAIYCMIWWVTLFTVLPLAGHRSAHESGEATLKGNDPGAPVKLNLKKAAKINTLVALVVWLLLLLFVFVIHVPLPSLS